MKILIVQESDWLERNPHQQHHLAEMLSLRGHEIRVIDHDVWWKSKPARKLIAHRQVHQAVPKVYEQARISVIRPGFVRLPVLDYVSLVFSHRREIKHQIREFAPDAVVALGILNAWLAEREAAKHSIPFIYYWLDVLHKLIPDRAFQSFGKMVELRTLRKADLTLVLNQRLKEYVMALGAREDRTRVLGAGINPAVFGDHAAAERAEVRRRYGIGDGDVVLFFMGFLYNFSGIREVAETLTKAADTRYKLLIVGDGDCYEDLQRLQESHNAAGRIILAGRKPYQEVPGLIAAADICLLPAYTSEPIMQDIVPIKLYEYLAMGRPVIASRLPGVMSEFGENSGVTYVGGPDEVIAEAGSLVAGGRLPELGRQARLFASGRTWDNIADKFEEMLKTVIEERSP